MLSTFKRIKAVEAGHSSVVHSGSRSHEYTIQKHYKDTSSSDTDIKRIMLDANAIEFVSNNVKPTMKKVEDRARQVDSVGEHVLDKGESNFKSPSDAVLTLTRENFDEVIKA